MPFVYKENFYVVHWLVNRQQKTVIHEFDIDGQGLLQSWHVNASWLVKHDPRSMLSGGTPFVPFNSSHYIGVGHLGKHKYRMFFMLLEMETFSVVAITNYFFINHEQKMVDFNESAIPRVNFPMSIHVLDDAVPYTVRVSIGIFDCSTVAVNLYLLDFKWYTQAGAASLK